MDKNILPDVLPGLNVAEAIRRIGIPPHIFKKILLKFVESCVDREKLMQESFVGGKYEELGEIAHALKGAAGNIGADDLHSVCFELGTSITAVKSHEVLSEIVDRAGVELRVVLASIAEIDSK